MNKNGSHEHRCCVLHAEETKRWLLHAVSEVSEERPRKRAQEYIQQQANDELRIDSSDKCDVQSLVGLFPVAFAAPCSERTDAEKEARDHNNPAKVGMYEQGDLVRGHALSPKDDLFKLIDICNHIHGLTNEKRECGGTLLAVAMRRCSGCRNIAPPRHLTDHHIAPYLSGITTLLL